MSVSVEDEYLDLLIASQHRAVRYHLIFATGLVLLGAFIMISSLLSAGKLLPESLKAFVGIGGGFVSSLSAFQIKEIMNRKDKVDTFRKWKARLPFLREALDDMSVSERNRIVEAIWNAMERIVQG